MQWVVKVAKVLVLEAHDTGRLWYCPPWILEGLRTLTLQGVLGADRYGDLERLAAFIKRVK